jgi:hypothetical protein
MTMICLSSASFIMSRQTNLQTVSLHPASIAGSSRKRIHQKNPNEVVFFWLRSSILGLSLCLTHGIIPNSEKTDQQKQQCARRTLAVQNSANYILDVSNASSSCSNPTV